MIKHLTNCPICDNSQFTTHLSCIDYTVSRETYTILKCSACDFKFTQDIPDQDSIGKYYQAESYVSHSGSKKGLINSLYHIVRKHSLKQKFNLVSSYTHGMRIIDYGCGTGEFLNTCLNKGWSVQGYEPSEDAKGIAVSQNGITANHPDDLKNYPDGGADIITLWHVLEHVHTLKDTITLLLEKLQPGGTFLIAVPNCSSLDAHHYGSHWAAYDVPRHLYHFEPDTINTLMHQFGLVRKTVKPMIFDAYYVSLLSEKYKNGGSLNPFSLISAFFTGLRSNLKASGNKLTYSSQIYIYTKP